MLNTLQGGEWDFWFNAFKPDEFINKESIINTLEKSAFKEMVESFAIDEIGSSNKLRKKFLTTAST